MYTGQLSLSFKGVFHTHRLVAHTRLFSVLFGSRLKVLTNHSGQSTQWTQGCRGDKRQFHLDVRKAGVRTERGL